MPESHQGECRCGRVRFRVAGEPLMTMACHCTGCQRMTGSAFSLSSLYPADAFQVTAGEPILGGLREETRHFFCPDCLTLQLQSVFDVSLSCRGLVSASPEGPCNDVGRTDAPLRQLHRNASDLLD